MALKLAAPIPLFSPLPPPPRRGGAATELRFSRWNNANAEPFLRRQREQQEIEADIRRHRRHVSASRLADVSEEYPPLPSPPSAPSFKSVGTPSTPSSPSIPGKASKYSKPPLPPKRSNPAPRHPAFRRVSKTRITPTPDGEAGISVGERGIVYKVKDAPFEFQYSYTETPKVKPIALREPPFLPFGPATTPRPWTGRAPLPESKKKLPEFDSFRLPPPGKKGVKPVQAPGPFLAGSGPRYRTATREEILGDPLTEEEVKDLVEGCMKTKRQLNMGRDGLTHNMLDNIHSHWKRRRVCKIKCKGVCTVDMDNVRQQLEEKTGGKIIYSRGGVLFLFRGRNYNYRTRPRCPLMLWRPITPVYPRLIPRVPEGLTLEEVTEMRNRGRQLPPIRKLAKNGLYSDLVKLVREAFEACELVRVDCSGLHKSDCRKIGAKLKDLVPCVLISFEYEHILMWRGKDWKSSLPPVEDDQDKLVGSDSYAPSDAPIISSSTTVPLLNPEGESDLHAEKIEVEKADLKMTTETMIMVKDVNIEGNKSLLTLELDAGKSRIEEFDYEKSTGNVTKLETAGGRDSLQETSASGALKGLIEHPSIDIHSQIMLPETSDSEKLKDVSFQEIEAQQLRGSSNAYSITDMDAVTRVNGMGSSDELDMLSKESSGCDKCLDGVMLLLSQAVENGRAVLLNEEASDADIVFKRSVALAKTAPPGPVFQHTIRKSRGRSTGKNNEEKGEGCKEQDLCVDLSTLDATEKRDSEKRKFKGQKRVDFRESFSDVVPHGSLRVDELARLLT